MQKKQSPLIDEIHKLPSLRVLIIDDDLSFTEVLEKIIYSLKFEVESVLSGTKGIEKLQQAEAKGTPFDIVFMDWIMPDMDGIDTILRINKEKKIKKIPKFVVISGHDVRKMKEKSKEEGIEVKILAKPYPINTL